MGNFKKNEVLSPELSFGALGVLLSHGLLSGVFFF